MGSVKSSGLCAVWTERALRFQYGPRIVEFVWPPSVLPASNQVSTQLNKMSTPASSGVPPALQDPIS